MQTTFILVKPSKKVLVYQRDDGNGKKIPYPNMWCIPGGSPEGAERSVDAIIREIYEEFEIKVAEANCELLTKYYHNGDNDDVFICRVPEEVVAIQHEGRDFRWMTFEEIQQLDLAWHQDELLDVLSGALKK
ncbi:MAG: hypothetical protein A2542_00605 [Parcubacteria group bacterium RIFOXYD2_FULL_52_8]|nr:MAG: hypothetical protein A2542_00605 [Parcubacteria group bacterium RIFOXYD2_FULL_52_8]